MKGKDHIRNREEKNKTIRIKKGGKTRRKSIGKEGAKKTVAPLVGWEPSQSL